jgi:hydrogenase maturation protein HypF
MASHEKDSRINSLLHQAWERRINTFETSAAGRLFDAAAALVLGRNLASFEGQGPMELEHIAADGCEPIPLPIFEDENGVARSDWAPLLDVLNDHGLPPKQRAGIFHESMARALVDQALETGKCVEFDAVGLSGGVFQNRRLTERVVELLNRRGLEVRLHRDIPANDGGLCFGQIIEAKAIM